jgi:hypothetical protein
MPVTTTAILPGQAGLANPRDAISRKVRPADKKQIREVLAISMTANLFFNFMIA